MQDMRHSRFDAAPRFRRVKTAGASFIVPVRDNAERLARCLASIRANRWRGAVEVIVVDNGSSDGSADVARRMGATVLHMPGERVARLRNAGAERASGEVLAFVDADHVIDPGWLAAAMETLSRSDIAAAGAAYVSPGSTWVQRAYDRFRVRTPGVTDVDWLGAGNLAVRRDAFREIGGFDERLQTCEDVDLCNRLQAWGWRVVTDDRLHSVHLGDPASLRAVLLGELWRGRDNITATLRGPFTLRAYRSLLISLLCLLLLVGLTVGLLTLAWTGPWVALLAATGLLAIAGARATRMTFSDRAWRVADLIGSFAVALIYELARALALIVRTGHGTRRRASELQT
jgi:GT2 family glycosyltransferase